MRRKLKKIHGKVNPFITVPNLIVALTTLVFVISVIAEILIPTYKTNPLLYTIMGIVVGGLVKSINK